MREFMKRQFLLLGGLDFTVCWLHWCEWIYGCGHFSWWYLRLFAIKWVRCEVRLDSVFVSCRRTPKLSRRDCGQDTPASPSLNSALSMIINYLGHAIFHKRVNCMVFSLSNYMHLPFASSSILAKVFILTCRPTRDYTEFQTKNGYRDLICPTIWHSVKEI